VEAVDVEVSKGDDAGDVTFENRVLIPLLGVECGGRKEDKAGEAKTADESFRQFSGWDGLGLRIFFAVAFGAAHHDRGVEEVFLRQSSESKPT
jgi:hypothetical protein